ncbi:MAG: presqualene diphosphate synthase HpnD [Dehalococcoidia bacterium]|nr:presqualene diphosphate synthase HpnD [Dehalococcoidia bacterium]
MSDELSAAYRHCQALTRREAKNFYYGFMLLPARQRRAIYAAYAFARECDDIVDAVLPVEDASARLAAQRELLDRCLEGSPQGPVFLALADAVRRYGIPHDYFYRLIEGVETDLTVSRYATFDDLKRYCYLVASVVGLISVEIFGYQGGEEARGHAADLGIALQLTNILRDVQEDIQRGRIYLPEDELARFGYKADFLRQGVANEAFHRLMAFQVARAEEYFEEGRMLLPLLPRRARACVGVMAGIYRTILDDIRRRPETVLRQRVSLSAGQKLALAGRELVRSFVL